MKIDEPGLYPNFPISAYHADPCPRPSFTQSVAKLLLDRSPAHVWALHPKLNPEFDFTAPEEYNAVRAIGDAAHLKLLGRGKNVLMIGTDNFRTKEAQTLRDEAMEAGKVPILLKHQRTVNRMVEVVQEKLLTVGIAGDFEQSAGDSEVVAAWQENGLWLRTLIDRLPKHRRRVIDYKTTGRNAAPHAVAMMMVDAGWDIQAAMHERALNVFDPENAGRREHVFIVQENEEPFAVTFCRMSESVMTMGRKKLAVARAVWAACMSAGHWPSYPAEMIEPAYPGFKEAAWLDREETEFSAEYQNVLMAG